MSHNPDDIVRIADGSLVQIEIWQGVLRQEGIVSQVVGTDLTAGIGTVIPGSVELWVHRSDEKRAKEVLENAESHKGSAGKVPHGPIAPEPMPPAPQGKHPHTHYQKDPRGN